MLLEWKPQYCVGEPTLDGQHKILVEMISDLQHAMLEARVSEELAGIFDRLVTYTKYHFAWEEQWLASRGIGSLEAHREEHARLTAEVVALRARFRSGRLSAGMPVLRLLQNWLLEHIDIRDRAVVEIALRTEEPETVTREVDELGRNTAHRPR